MNSAPRTRVRWIDVPALVVFVVLAAVVLLQFLSRYVLNDSVAWTEEIGRYLLICVAYAGSVTALRKGEHIFLEVIYRRVHEASVKPLVMLVDLVNLSFHVVLTLLAIGLTLSSDRRMVSVDIPKNVVYGFVAIALMAATIMVLIRLLRHARQDGGQIRNEIEQSATGGENA